jgi:hypothetical protein
MGQVLVMPHRRKRPGPLLGFVALIRPQNRKVLKSKNIEFRRPTRDLESIGQAILE